MQFGRAVRAFITTWPRRFTIPPIASCLFIQRPYASTTLSLSSYLPLLILATPLLPFTLLRFTVSLLVFTSLAPRSLRHFPPIHIQTHSFSFTHTRSAFSLSHTIPLLSFSLFFPNPTLSFSPFPSHSPTKLLSPRLVTTSANESSRTSVSRTPSYPYVSTYTRNAPSGILSQWIYCVSEIEREREKSSCCNSVSALSHYGISVYKRHWISSKKRKRKKESFWNFLISYFCE